MTSPTRAQRDTAHAALDAWLSGDRGRPLLFDVDGDRITVASGRFAVRAALEMSERRPVLPFGRYP